VALLAEKDLQKHDSVLLPEVQEHIGREEIKKKLEQIIGQMLSEEFEKLCNTMYRLDVSEIKFHHILNNTPSEEISGELADLVIDREIQKIKTRELYRKNKI